MKGIINSDLVESLYERANEIQWEMIEAAGEKWKKLNEELTEIELQLDELDVTYEEIEMMRDWGWI